MEKRYETYKAMIASETSDGKIYCSVCGSLMKSSLNYTHVNVGYDPHTGKKLDYYIFNFHEWNCPKRHWWNNHDYCNDAPKPTYMQRRDGGGGWGAS